MMKTILLPKKLQRILLYFILMASIFSCSKRSAENTFTSTVLHPAEFINYNVNGIDYSFTMPVDGIVANNAESAGFMGLYDLTGNRIPSNSSDFSRIFFQKVGIVAGSDQLLKTFYTGQTGYVSNDLPGYGTMDNPILVHITEYGDVGEFMAGNFSGRVTGPAPANAAYNITCSFRIKRYI